MRVLSRGLRSGDAAMTAQHFFASNNQRQRHFVYKPDGSRRLFGFLVIW